MCKRLHSPCYGGLHRVGHIDIETIEKVRALNIVWGSRKSFEVMLKPLCVF